MKRYILFLCLLAASLQAQAQPGFHPPSAPAAGLVATSCAQVGTSPVWLIYYVWTGSASDGSSAATAAPCAQQIAQLQGYSVTSIEVIPGTGTAPTAGYAATLKDGTGLDIAGGLLTGLSATVPALFAVNTAPLNGTLTIAVTGNSVNSATGTFVVSVAPGNFARSRVPTNGGSVVYAGYRQTFTSQTSVVLAHNLNSSSVEVQCYNAGSPPQRVEPNTLQLTDANDATVTFTVGQSGSCVVK